MEIMGTTNGAKPIKYDFMRCPRNRCDGNNENANFVLQQIIFSLIRSFASHAPPMMEITFHFILEHVLSLCCLYLCTISIRDI